MKGTHFLNVCTVTAASVAACGCRPRPSASAWESQGWRIPPPRTPDRPASVCESVGQQEGPRCFPPPGSLLGDPAGATPTVVHPCGRYCCQVCLSGRCDHMTTAGGGPGHREGCAGQGGGRAAGNRSAQSVPASGSPACIGSLFRGIREEIKGVVDGDLTCRHG